MSERFLSTALPLTLILNLGGCSQLLSIPLGKFKPISAESSYSHIPYPYNSPFSCHLRPSLQMNSSLSLPNKIPLSPTQTHFIFGGIKTIGIGYLGPLRSSIEPDNKYPNIGFSEAPNSSDLTNYSWGKRFILPLYSSPNSSVQGWIACGWIVTRHSNEKEIFKPQLFFPGYSGFGFIVLEEYEDEWLKVRYSDAGLIGDGIAWVRVSQLQLSTVPLGFISWRGRYQSQIEDAEQLAAKYPDMPSHGVSLVFFHGDQPYPNKRYAVRVTPSDQAEVVHWIDSSHSIEPLEIQDEWMYVRVHQPSNYCLWDEGTYEVYEGWIHWLTPQEGNLLGEHYKGC